MVRDEQNIETERGREEKRRRERGVGGVIGTGLKKYIYTGGVKISSYIQC